MMNLYFTLLFLSISSTAFIKPLECQCEYFICYYAGKDSTFITVEACHLPKIETRELNDSTRVFVMVQSCKGNGLMQVYEHDKLIEERHYKNATKLNMDTIQLINLNGDYVGDTIFGCYYPQYKNVGHSK